MVVDLAPDSGQGLVAVPARVLELASAPPMTKF
jgi:hypothetical protein